MIRVLDLHDGVLGPRRAFSAARGRLRLGGFRKWDGQWDVLIARRGYEHVSFHGQETRSPFFQA